MATASNEHTAHSQETLEQLKLIADDTRWRLLIALRYSDHQVSELVERLDLSQNLISYHLGVLRQAGLVQVHRSDADARVSYYSINLSALSAIYRRLGTALRVPTQPFGAVDAHPTVVFLCTANSARSQMAEGWLRHLSGGRIVARSAGTRPATLHPLAVQVMAERGIDIGYQQSKHIDALADLVPDVVVTICDIARTECAVWHGVAYRLHWSLPDPLTVMDPTQTLKTFRAVRNELHQRIEGLLGLLVPPG
ncbi:MAG: metalloregulator ArsR/SmtB family transcription factor [Chloroflexales bacterium]|nr:metalloregulator ArsR/SmtB family transcription factor [Chloroflexales bacterium]